MSRFSLDEYSPSGHASVAIGVFDGIHIGHQAVLEQNFDAGRSAGLRAACLTFDPHPAQVLAPSHAPKYICSLSQRIELMLASGFVDDVVVATFTLEFAKLLPHEFIERVLVGQLKARMVCVGADFRYGKGRVGSVMDLEAAGETLGFGVQIVHAVGDNSQRVSSTTVRECIKAGDVDQAQRLLGRLFTLRGTVARGKRLGTEIGFPTINLALEQPRQLLPADGVYAGYAQVGDTKAEIRAAISVGTNPTTDGDPARKVEAYLLDGYNSDCYGERVDLSFARKLREQVKYADIDALVGQIRADVEEIQRTLPIVAP